MRVRIDLSKIPDAGSGVFAVSPISEGTYLETYFGKTYSAEDYARLVDSGQLPSGYGFDVLSSNDLVTDASSPNYSNWTRYMNCARSFDEENVYFKDTKGKIKFYALRDIEPGEELLFFYGDAYADSLGIRYHSPHY